MCRRRPSPAPIDHGSRLLSPTAWRQARGLVSELIGRPPLIVSPYDAELFGHWWFEGPQFIESIFRAANAAQGAPLHASHRQPSTWPSNPVASGHHAPSASSWGDNGYNGVWLNPTNDWIYRHLHIAEERMIEAARRFPEAIGEYQQALNQMARELLLAQASDWGFIMTTGTTVPYATRRTRDHLNRFTGLYEMVMAKRIDIHALHEIAWRDTAFPEIDYRIYGR